MSGRETPHQLDKNDARVGGDDLPDVREIGSATSERSWSSDSVAALFETMSPRLRRCIANWLPVAVQHRFGVDDILQDAALGAIRHPERMESLSVEPFVWFRSLAREALAHRLRKTVDAAKRTVHREMAMDHGAIDPETSRKLAAALADSRRSPSSEFRLQESVQEISDAISRLNPNDQQTLQLLFFEGLSTTEASQVLEISAASVSTRKLRALDHLRSLLRQDGATLEG